MLDNMWLFISLLAFIASLISHTILCRVFILHSKLNLYLFSGLLIGACIVILNGWMYGFVSIATYSSSSLYGFLCAFYIFIFSSSLSSISINTIILIGNGSLLENSIGEIYSGEKMVALRLQRLISTGLAKKDSRNQVTITLKGKKFLKSMISLNQFFLNSTRN